MIVDPLLDHINHYTVYIAKHIRPWHYHWYRGRLAFIMKITSINQFFKSYTTHDAFYQYYLMGVKPHQWCHFYLTKWVLSDPERNTNRTMISFPMIKNQQFDMTHDTKKSVYCASSSHLSRIAIRIYSAFLRFNSCCFVLIHCYILN